MAEAPIAAAPQGAQIAFAVKLWEDRRVMGISMDDIRRLSVAERIQLVEDIWDSIALSQEDLPLTARQRAELDRRLGEYSKDPAAGRSWDVIREDPRPPE